MSVMGTLIGLAAGVATLTVFMRSVYPSLRRAHEAAKVTQTQGRDPAVYRVAVQIICTLIVPAAGYVLGGALEGK